MPEVKMESDPTNLNIRLIATNHGPSEVTLVLRANAYRTDGPWTLTLPPGRRLVCVRSVAESYGWYDFTVTGEAFERRFAGRMESGAPSFSDPAV
jgi:phospholipase C